MPDALDDLDRMAEIDVSGMVAHISSFPDQVGAALGLSIDLPGDVPRACVCGIGGSAIAGDILSEHLSEVSATMLPVVRGPDLPGWVDADTLVVVVTYSGNTKESLELFHVARERGCRIVGVASGGRLLEECKTSGIPFLRVPSGIMPRAALGYLLGSIALVIERAQLASAAADLRRILPELAAYGESVVPHRPSRSNEAKMISMKLHGRLPAIYAPKPLRPAATRWQTQINENSKMLAVSGEIPEMNHNQIIGWLEGENPGNCLPVFLTGRSVKGTMLRIVEETARMFEEGGLRPVVVDLPGRTHLETALLGVILGDFVSYYLAMLKGVDPTPVRSIQELKRRLE